MQLSANLQNARTRMPGFVAGQLALRHPGEAHAPRGAWRGPALPDYAGARSVTIEHEAWNQATVIVAQVRAAGEVRAALTADCARILVAVEEVGGPFALRGEAVLRRAPAATTGGVSVVPAGVEVSGAASKLSFLRHLIVQLDEAGLEDALGDALDIGRALAPRLMSADPRAVSLARMIADECNGTAAHDRLFRDSIMLAFLSALAGGTEHAPGRARGGLAAWQVRRTIDFIVENLGSDIDLAQLAGGVGLSKSHFCRGFKETTGLPPHKWLINARVERAKEHLLAGKLSLSEIALEVGFSDQSHFTRTFSKNENISPRAWLRSRL
ncbi:helix-turn-helix transcriptional regulator [Salinarimonas soli]|uniref:Helix-turn-helix transcriptional regulator n=1 Tax=Salinarimonas soli TaxID=1638099 RepID=A0A5B2VH30_9HYPH|nr:AraC family transcriptional regulator [Salinarimonas soli]KAA2238245.1 helix-turn-helix transcriptional regulator [Salinarimonas soli]